MTQDQNDFSFSWGELSRHSEDPTSLSGGPGYSRGRGTPELKSHTYKALAGSDGWLTSSQGLLRWAGNNIKFNQCGLLRLYPVKEELASLSYGLGS